MGADIYPRNRPERADKVDGAIGEGSSFYELHGYYAQGVGETTAVLPNGWRSRLVAVNNENTNGVTGFCLEVHDLAVSKIIAQRPKDLEFIQTLIGYDVIQQKIMLRRLEETEMQESVRARIQAKIKSLFTV